uniref:Uncharacterized protein n=1 Tax=Tanacetum cinerariifolium TaxID=118510 RepID=A0A6L2LC65_TANCI|nr:hypothetical protein [Tanacetum cinerariifolium]
MSIFIMSAFMWFLFFCLEHTLTTYASVLQSFSFFPQLSSRAYQEAKAKAEVAEKRKKDHYVNERLSQPLSQVNVLEGQGGRKIHVRLQKRRSFVLKEVLE